MTSTSSPSAPGESFGIGRLSGAALGTLAALSLLAACGGGESVDQNRLEADALQPEAPAALVLTAPSELLEIASLTDASPPGATPDQPGGAFGYSHYVFEPLGDDVVTTLVEGPLEEQVRLAVSYQQLRELSAGGEAPPDEFNMSRHELELLVRQLDDVRASTAKYRDIEVALTEGYVQLTDQVPNMGAHFAHLERTIDGVFDPSQPEILIYNRNDEGEWELSGTSFVLPYQLVGTEHPKAFAGPLDNWHVHYSLCTGPGTISRSSTPEECRAQKGIWVPSYGWMIHAWVWEDNPLGVFHMWHPGLPPVAAADDIRSSRTTAIAVDGAMPTSIENFSFDSVRLKIGEALVWTNVDGIYHTVTAGAESASFDSGLIGPGQSFAVRFDQPGDYPFACSLHPQMTGTVVVSE